MVLANTAQGETRQFDLTDGVQLRALTALIYSGHVTALAILSRGVQHTLPPPKRFGNRKAIYSADVLRNGTRMPDGSQAAIGERVSYQVGEVRVSLTATFSGSLVRCDVIRIGRQRFDPKER